MKQIDTYLSNIEPIKRKKLERIRKLVKKLMPQAEEAIYYAMPGLKYKGKGLICYDDHKNHIGIYPCSGSVITKLQDELKGYKTTSGAIQIPLDEEIPETLLKRIIHTRVEEIDTKKTK